MSVNAMEVPHRFFWYDRDIFCLFARFTKASKKFKMFKANAHQRSKEAVVDLHVQGLW